MRFDPFLAERRFGYGLSPHAVAPTDVAQMLEGLGAFDEAQANYPIASYRSLQDAQVLRRRFDTYARKNPETPAGKEAFDKSRQILRDMRDEQGKWFCQWQMRRITSSDGFRERLVSFWADHFTVNGKRGLLRVANPLYVEEAVRPNINSSFAELLMSCVTHPLMLHYLDQLSSVGPNSLAAKRGKRVRGLNENLAREVLELHTLGVDAPYAQTDVRQLAELFTGMAATRDYSFKFRRVMVEPGAEIVLGKTYANKGGMAPIREVLNDLARHPATAAHIARKLVVHFVSDSPPPDLVAHVTDAYLRTDGALAACYAALLEHPKAWISEVQNIRPPDEFISAALRALGVTQKSMQDLTPAARRNVFFRPLGLMGQPWLRPSGPDGFAEDDAAWVTPQGISARLEWAVSAPARLVARLPDPRSFVNDALGPEVTSAVVFAANSAESRKVAIGLILASPAFQRR